MRASFALSVVGASVLGFGVGAWAFRGSGDGEDEIVAASGREGAGPRREARHDHRDDERDDGIDERARERPLREGRDDEGEETPTAAPPTTTITLEELARRQLELDARIAEARRERNDLFGAPVPAPANAPARFEGTSIATSLRGALETEGVEGEIEGVDCSEHPCIAFGRLRGDEEDVEELERSPALDAYRDDTLVLLLWATTAREAEPAQGDPERAASPEETAIFALAFLPSDGVTESIERRIRARVFEVWNVERPGRDVLEPPAI